MSTDSPPAILATGLIKRFGDQRAVDGIDLVVPRGRVFGVLGPNGAGKTTMLKMLTTLLPLDGGRAEILGHDVRAEPHLVRQLLGVTGQYASVDEALTARENLVIFAKLHRLPRPRERAAELLEQFALTEAADRPLRGFSGGMRRRLDIAASLVARPRLIFLDEPTTGLDPRTRVQMWDTVRELVRSGSTVVLTTQYLEEADELADRIAVIDRGRLVADDTAEALKRSVGSSTLHLTLATRHDLREAIDLVRTVAGVEPVVDRPQVLVPSTDGDAAADVIAALRARGIAITDLDLRRPSLDDVFFALTGQSGAPRDAAGPSADPVGAPDTSEDPTLVGGPR